MAFKFPFTNYHELNLTWVLDQLKKLFEESAENVSVIQTYDGRLTAVETELPTISENAAEAARSAAAAASLAQTAKATAETAQENAIQAQGLAGQARQEAQAAQRAADSATQAAQQAQAVSQNFDGRITQAENDASQALEASRSFENRVQAAITTANNAANTATNAQGIAMRADQNAALALDTLNSQRAELERIGAEQASLIADETANGKAEIEAMIDTIPEDYSALSELVDKKAPVIIVTASGAVVSFNDGADNMKVQKLVADIVPVQAEGTPSQETPLPISGKTGATIHNFNDNLASNIEVRKPATVYSGSDLLYVRFPVTIPEGTRLSISLIATATSKLMTNANIITYRYFEGTGSAQSINGLITKVTLQANTRYALVKSNINGNIATDFYNVMINYGTTALPYIPAVHFTLPLNWQTEAGTIYGGSVTLNQDGSAEIVSTMGNIASYAGETLPGKWLSSMDVYTEGASPTTGAQVVYELEEPVSYHFDNVGQLKTFLGSNNIWINTGNITECYYPADTKLYIDGKIAELQALVLENN